MERKRTVQVLYLGSIERNEDYLSQEKPIDQIDFGRPVRITLVRIPKFKRELYGKLTSITQSEPIKNFEIFFRNLEETTGRYSLLASNSELMATSTSDILITPTKAFVTDLLVIRGLFSKLSLCIYGDLVQESEAKLWVGNGSVAEAGMVVQIKRNIFSEKRICIQQMEEQLLQYERNGLNLSVIDAWQEAATDDDFNEPQIKNICNISQHLLNTFQQINDDTYIVKFRENIENINNMLQKLFKSKQLGLYYNKHQNYTLMNEIPLPLVHIALQSLKLLPSDQFRVLETLKMLAQLPSHANAIIDFGGVSQLSSLFLDFYKPNAVLFSTYKNLVLEVCIALSQWPTAAQRMVTKLDQDFYEQIWREIISNDKQPISKSEASKDRPKDKGRDKGQREKDKDKQKDRQHSRSRDKAKQKRAKSGSVESNTGSDKEKRKKDKKDKKRKKDKDKEKSRQKSREKSKEKTKKKDRSKEREERKDKDKDKDKEKKQKKKDKQKEKIKEKESKGKSEESMSPSQRMQEQSEVSVKSVSNLSFYELLFLILIKEKNSKTLNLIKILIEQIVQTLTKNKDLSEQIALVTSFLRDTKYLFNQGSEIINSKSLKVFATFQPFLNEIQSENVDCRYIAEKQKLKNPLKYGINPKTFRIVSKINQNIVDFSPKEQYSFGTPYDESFMVMMSQLIFQKEKPILSGFNRIVNSFKADGLMPLQRHQAAISIMTEYIYKALLDDEGFNTLLYLDQIHSSLIKFISYLNEDPSIFSTQLKSRIKLLSNYAIPYDNFSRAQGILKTFCEYFLRLFKYENYQIEINNKAKLTDFRKKEYEKLMNPFLYENLMENFALKNFNDVSQSQPLLEIDVCLKIFLVLCDYNKNIWTTFYENKLVSGFSSLLNKVSSLLIFFLSHSPNRWTSYASTKNYLATVDNYLTVVKHILMLMSKKCRYESAYNDLLQEDIFEDVQLYEQSIEIFVTLYNAYHDQSLMVYIKKSQNKIKTILTLVTKILDHFLTSYELISQTRQSKLAKLIEHLYIKHYSSLASRPAILAIFAHLIRLSEGSTGKYFLQNLLDNHFTANKLFQNEIAYIPTNDRSIIENLIKTNIYRANPLIVNNLSLLLKNLFSKPIFVDKSLDIMDRLFQEIDEASKKDQEDQGQMCWTSIRKAHLFSQVLVETGVAFKSRLDDKMMRFFKRMLENSRKRIDLSELTPKEELQNFVVFLKLKNNFMTYFGRLIDQNPENNIFLNYYELTSKVLSFEYFNSDVEKAKSNLLIQAINIEVLRSCKIYIESLAQVSLNAYYQCLLLYGQVLQKPYRPQTLINFAETLTFLQKIHSENILGTNSQQIKITSQIICSIFYFLGNLTTTDGQNLFTTESRRLAIISLIVPNEKQFPFKYLRSSKIFKIIPKELFSILQQFFNYPIVEKPIVIKERIQPKPAVKPKTTIYSKSVFSIISQHDPVSKTRYRYIGGEWVGGDIQKSLYTPFRVRNYEEEIDKTLLPKTVKDYEQYHLRKYQFQKEKITYNELFYLSIKKDRQDIPKKQVQKTIQLKDVIPRYTPQQIKKEMPKQPPSSSPTKMMPQPAINPSYQAPNMHNMPSRSPGSSEKGYNRNSNPRSGSNNPPNYQSPSRYYNPRPNIHQPPGQMQMPPMQGYGSHMPPSNYPQHSYPPPQYYNPQQMHPNMYQRYPPSYPPPQGGMYMNPQGMNRPMPPTYDQSMHSGMYGPPPGQSLLNQYEDQLFHEALSVLNEIKTSTLSEAVMNEKKNRLNFILSNYPKVHQKLKESLPQKS